VAAVALVTALMATLRARAVARRLDKLIQSYWDLRYEHGQLSARVSRLEPDEKAAPDTTVAPRPAPPATAFVPLSSLKR
jgi:hypothetical protein